MNRLHAFMIFFFVVGITAYAHNVMIDSTDKLKNQMPGTAVVQKQTNPPQLSNTNGEMPTILSLNAEFPKTQSPRMQAIKQTSNLLYETLSDLGEAPNVDSVYLETVFHSK